MKNKKILLIISIMLLFLTGMFIEHVTASEELNGNPEEEEAYELIERALQIQKQILGGNNNGDE